MEFQNHVIIIEMGRNHSKYRFTKVAIERYLTFVT